MTLSTQFCMADYDADVHDEITIPLGATCTLESIRLGEVPPLMFPTPFLETPSHVSLTRQVAHDETGSRSLEFTLRGDRTGHGSLRLGFRDLRSETVVKEKTIRVIVS